MVRGGCGMVEGREMRRVEEGEEGERRLARRSETRRERFRERENAQRLSMKFLVTRTGRRPGSSQLKSRIHFTAWHGVRF